MIFKRLFGKSSKRYYSPLKSDNSIIIRSDGGICSQIAFHALGERYKELGFDVKYDLTWFQICGQDILGNHTRNFQLENAFPGLDVSVARGSDIERYKALYSVSPDSDMELCRPPAYIGGYPETAKYVGRYARLFRDLFKPVESDQIATIRHRIMSTPSCAVHVRRGDLASRADGDASIRYFIRAIQLVRSIMSSDVCFWFFSDDPSYVRKEIFSFIPNGVNFELVDVNSQQMGYMDLYLMTFCQSMVASIGSAGLFAYLLKKTQSGVLVLPRLGRISEESHTRSLVCSMHDVVFINNV